MRYKGRPSEQTLLREFPHVVEIVVPLGGFGRKLDTMHAHLRDVEHVRGRGRREGEQDLRAGASRDVRTHSRERSAGAVSRSLPTK